MKNKPTFFLGMGLIYIFLLCACGRTVEVDNYQYSKNDVSDLLESADISFAKGNYEDSLDSYLNAMVAEPKNVEARIGAAKCQMELGNYDVAYDDLLAAIQIDTKNAAVYDLIIELSKQSENITYAIGAVNMARQYEVTEFIAKIPAKPTISEESGKYNHRLNVKITDNAADGELFYTVNNGKTYNIYDAKYTDEIPIITGDTILSAYTLVDGIPSETVTREYICEYEGTPVQFVDSCMEKIVRETLDIRDRPITDVDCEKITKIYSNKLRTTDVNWDTYKDELNILSLEDLKYFPCLEVLCLDYQEKITDYSPITKCALIYDVSIEHAELTDANFLSGLNCLEYIYLTNNDIKDINFLYDLKDLYRIDVSGNPNLNLNDIYRMENLESLTIDENQISDYSVLYEMKSLNSISIYGQGGMNLTPIGEITNLTSFSYLFDWDNYDYNNIIYFEDISPLTKLKKLDYISIDCMGDFSNLECLSTLPNLNTLYLHDTNYYSYGDKAKDEAVAKLQKLMPACNIDY